jgi:hypothetical protein
MCLTEGMVNMRNNMIGCHFIVTVCLSRATSMSAELPTGKLPTTRILSLISRMISCTDPLKEVELSKYQSFHVTI